MHAYAIDAVPMMDHGLAVMVVGFGERRHPVNSCAFFFFDLKPDPVLRKANGTDLTTNVFHSLPLP